MTDRAKVIERINLLLNLGRDNPNPNEAEAAVAKAAKLMDDYRISKEEVGKEDLNIQSLEVGTMRMYIEIRFIRSLLENHFNIESIGHEIRKSVKRRLVLYGYPADIEVARQVFSTLLAAFRQRWNVHRKKAGHADLSKTRCQSVDRFSFMSGLRQGVATQLRRLREARPPSEQNALVVIEKSAKEAIYDFYKREGMTFTTKSYTKGHEVHKKDYEAGFVEGLTIHAQPRVGDSAPSPQQPAGFLM